jgi:hypothetical protein
MTDKEGFQLLMYVLLCCGILCSIIAFCVILHNKEKGGIPLAVSMQAMGMCLLSMVILYESVQIAHLENLALK